MDDLIAEFLTETTESLAELDLALVKLESSPDDHDTLGLIFRLVHTVKGTCGFLGLTRLEHLAHAAENVLGKVRDRELAATPAVISAVLASLDRVRLILAGLGATGSEPQGDDTTLIENLDRAMRGDAPTAKESGAESPAREAAQAAEPAEHGPDGGDAAAAQGVPLGGQTIRVGVDVLEELMTLVGELVLTRNQLLQIARAQGTTEFSAPLQRLSHITTDLQEGVMKTRMQPIGNAWNKLPRLVRDLARETGKKIALDMNGQDTELDRQVLELMRDPLTHMVRNSADHGLETPDTRRAAGKPETGRIRLNAYHEGGHIIIEVADDGRGLDTQKLRDKIVEKKLVSEADAAGMTESQIRAFIFHAGFSTAAQVTAISGRGVGMDVVRSNIERIGGTIDLSSTLGKGTCFTIKIPLTLAIVSALIVQVSGERFAIPQINVLELVRVKGDGSDGAMRIEHVGQTPVLRLRERLLPLVSLSDALRLESETAASRADQTIVVTAVGKSMLGIIVDEVFDTEEIVVKPVAPILRHVTMFTGNTILGDGSVVMILDPNGIARAAGVSANRDAGARGEAERAADTRKSSDAQALLLFRAGGEPMTRVVPLGLVARLEDIPKDRIEQTTHGLVTQYRGKLMPLIDITGLGQLSEGESQTILVFSDSGRCMGLMVDAIIDVVHDRLDVELGTNKPGLMGTAVVAGRAADVLDTVHWLTMSARDWFSASKQQTRRVLVVEDSTFFRQLLAPALSAAGYDVMEAATGAEALRLRDNGLMVDAVISDIDMPGIDGLELARQIREGGPWADLPLIALSGHDTAADDAAGRAAGFTDYCNKGERDLLLATLAQCLGERVHS
jgi:two-component system chemotaxis sensor kinase CheA